MRCVALAEELRARGHGATVVGDVEGALLREQVTSAGAGLVHLPRDEPAGPALARVATERGADVVHVDRYDGGELLDDLERVGAPLLLSNISDGRHGLRAAHLAIDATLGAEHDALPHRAATKLRGVRFAPLRRRVTELRGSPRDQRSAPRVLVLMGGTDARGLLPRVLELLGATGQPLDVVAIDPRSTVATETREGALRLTRRPPDPDVARLMAASDLVVSAAGVSTLELLCLGVPAALVLAAENQRTGYERFVQAGAAVGAGDLRDDVAARTALSRLVSDPALRVSLGERGRQLVDGLGRWRVVGAWELLAGALRTTRHEALRFRAATAGDADLLLRWRNDPATRLASRDTAVVDAEKHRRWLDGSLRSSDRHLFVVHDGEGAAGTVRWDRAESLGEWEVSITVAPERRGTGLAGAVLAAAEQALHECEPSAVTMLATVRSDNARSMRTFTTAGYTPDLPPDANGLLRLLKQR
jgi:spore coat polysaccharide biosynthesis predicted glycosyltransferase SpsG/RimJ/RimL family protein N-acetyltransferase